MIARYRMLVEMGEGSAKGKKIYHLTYESVNVYFGDQLDTVGVLEPWFTYHLVQNL